MPLDETNTRRTGVIVGVLFIIATSFLFLGEVFYRSYLDAPDVLTIAAQYKTVILFGLLIELICILAMPLIGAFIFPVLSRVSIGMALSYFFFRALEGIILITVALTNKLALLSLSEAQVAGTELASAANTLALIRAQNFWANTDGPLYNIIFALGAICLYGTLFHARLIPRWISVWGLIGIVILLILLGTAAVIPLPPMAQLVLIPIAVQEMVMALWFIFRGFDFETVEARSGRTAEVSPEDGPNQKLGVLK